jgi:hypothetical protein
MIDLWAIVSYTTAAFFLTARRHHFPHLQHPNIYHTFPALLTAQVSHWLIVIELLQVRSLQSFHCQVRMLTHLSTSSSFTLPPI